MFTFNKKALFIFSIAVLLLSEKTQANPLVLDDIHVDSDLSFSSSMVSSKDKNASYSCSGRFLKTFVDSDTSLLLKQNIKLPTEEFSNCGIHIKNNKLFVIQSSEYFVYLIDDSGLLTFSNSSSIEIGHFNPSQFFSISEDILLLKAADLIKIVKFNANNDTPDYAQDIALTEKNMTNMYSYMFQSGEFLVEYVKGYNSAEVIKYKFQNDALSIVNQWYSKDLVDIGFNDHNAHNFFVSSGIDHLVYTHDELQIIYELTADGQIIRRYRGTEAIRLESINRSADALIGKIDQDVTGRTWGYTIDFGTYTFVQHALISEGQTYWKSFDNKYAVKNRSEAITFDDNFQVLKNKPFDVSNGLAQVPYFSDAELMRYDEENQKLYVLGNKYAGWKLYQWQYEPDLNTLNYEGAYNFNLPYFGDKSPLEMYFLGLANNNIYVKYTPKGENLSDIIYTITLDSNGFKLAEKYELGNSNLYSIYPAQIENNGFVLLHEDDAQHSYTWCPIQPSGVINSCVEKQFAFSKELVRPSGTYKIVKLNQAGAYLMYGAEYGRERKYSRPQYSDAHIVHFDASKQMFTLSSSLQGIDRFIDNVFTNEEWSEFFLQVEQYKFKGYSLEGDGVNWLEFTPDEIYDATTDKVKQDSIFVTNDCETYIYSEVNNWLYQNSRDEGDFWSSSCFPINSAFGFNLGSLTGSPAHMATYKVTDLHPTRQIINFPYRPKYLQDEIINFDLAKYFVNQENLFIQQGGETLEFDGRFLTGAFDKYDVTGRAGDTTTHVLTLANKNDVARTYEIWFRIENINDAPVLTAPLAKDKLNVGDTYGGDFNQVFIDLEGDFITYNYEYLPSEFQILGNGIIEGVFNQSGEYSFVVIATDSQGAITRETVEFVVQSPSSGGSNGFLLTLMLGALLKIRRCNC